MTFMKSPLSNPIKSVDLKIGYLFTFIGTLFTCISLDVSEDASPNVKSKLNNKLKLAKKKKKNR